MVAPRNLLSVYGSIEPAMVQSFGRRLVAGPDATDEDAQGVVPGRTYGRIEDGSARRFVLASGAEHIGVLYHATSQRESLEWLRQAFDAFGPKRLFWGTDLSRSPVSYRDNVTMFTEQIPWLAGDDLEWVMGRGVCEWLGWPA